MTLREWIAVDASQADARRTEHRRRLMIGWLNELLIDVVGGNSKNQQLLFGKIELFINNIGKIQRSDDVVAAIFRGNSQLCRLVSSSLLQKLLSHMERSFRHGVRATGLIDALQSIVLGSAALLLVRMSLGCLLLGATVH